MANMMKFAAQQLTKSQMNHIRGGVGVAPCIGMKYNIEIQYEDKYGNIRRVYGCGNTEEDAFRSGINSLSQGIGYKNFSYTWF